MSDCLFCKIVAGEIPAKVVAESETALAFYDIAPQAPVHVLVIPKVHVSDINDLEADHPVMEDLIALVQTVVELEGVKDSGYRLIVNVGVDAQQSVPHLHVHVMGGRRLAWPPG
jgi:histidine triad (HIT) family protein